MSSSDSDLDDVSKASLRRLFGTMKMSNQSDKDESEKYDDRALKILQELPQFNKECLYKYKCITSQDEAHSYIITYVKNSQDHGFKIKIENIVRVVRDGDYEFNHIPKMKERFRLMLWHGTKKEAIANILKNGFHRPQHKGQMFGNGIYFADRSSKSARYCIGGKQPCDPPKNSFAYLLLCDVMVGKAYNAKNAHNDFEKAPATTRAKFDSVKCTGEYIPNTEEQIEFDGAKWPIGKTVKNTKFPSYSVRYNEYTIYEPTNVNIKYIVKVKFS